MLLEDIPATGNTESEAVIATGEKALYANILLQKGVV